MTYFERMVEEMGEHAKHLDPFTSAHAGCPEDWFEGATQPEECDLVQSDADHDYRICVRCWLREAEEDKQ